MAVRVAVSTVRSTCSRCCCCRCWTPKHIVVCRNALGVPYTQPMTPPLPPFAAVDTTHSASPVISGTFDTFKLCRLPVLQSHRTREADCQTQQWPMAAVRSAAVHRGTAPGTKERRGEVSAAPHLPAAVHACATPTGHKRSHWSRDEKCTAACAT